MITRLAGLTRYLVNPVNRAISCKLLRHAKGQLSELGTSTAVTLVVYAMTDCETRTGRDDGYEFTANKWIYKIFLVSLVPFAPLF